MQWMGWAMVHSEMVQLERGSFILYKSQVRVDEGEIPHPSIKNGFSRPLYVCSIGPIWQFFFLELIYIGIILQIAALRSILYYKDQ